VSVSSSADCYLLPDLPLQASHPAARLQPQRLMLTARTLVTVMMTRRMRRTRRERMSMRQVGAQGHAYAVIVLYVAESAGTVHLQQQQPHSTAGA
jgi:hypothetical protein